MCFASWFPPCRWDVFLIRKKYFSHRQGGNRKQGSNTHCGRQLPVYGGNLSASSKQGASKQPANKQQQAASKQPASKQTSSSQQAASKQATASSQPAASQQQASSKPAAGRQQASKKQAASRKIPSFFWQYEYGCNILEQCTHNHEFKTSWLTMQTFFLHN